MPSNIFSKGDSTGENLELTACLAINSQFLLGALSIVIGLSRAWLAPF